ncbi:MAG: B12-binding domain-containing radical SAM protein [Candidatus Riflebacteria bacterium]|nr:B12-binding domain-containing radical SAM protein [Candidatus Riflebacteria bacterium]
MMNKNKIILVPPPLLWEDKLRLSFQPPLNLLYLFSYLKAHDFDVELLDVVSLECSMEETVIRILDASPAFVGIPLYYASLDNAFALVSRLKAHNPALKFIAGGPCMTMEPDRMMREGSFDFGIIGEGEETLAALLSTRDSNASPESIPGLAFHKGDTVLINPRRPPIINLDALPYLDFSVLNNEYYFKYQEEVHVPRTLFLNSSRGCSFRCTYCCTPVLWPGKIRRFSPGRLVNEIIFQRERFPGVDIGFCDDSFFSDKEWLMEFIRLIKPLQIKYQCIGRADHLTADLIRLLVESGLNYIAFGVETGSSQWQSRLKKNLDLSALVRNMRELTKYDVKTKCFFMLGFPDETSEDMAATINMASTLKRNGMTFFSIFPVTVYPGTELSKQFSNQPFKIGLDAHLPEIIRDDLGISEKNAALLNSPFNSSLTNKQMVNLVTFAYNKVEHAEIIEVDDINRVIRM